MKQNNPIDGRWFDLVFCFGKLHRFILSLCVSPPVDEDLMLIFVSVKTLICPILILLDEN